MKEYTQEQMIDIERTINRLIMFHERYDIRELCMKEEYALHYFINKAIDEISRLDHITNIIKERWTMRRYHYNPTKPHQYILSSILGAALATTYIYLIIYTSYIIGG